MRALLFIAILAFIGCGDDGDSDDTAETGGQVGAVTVNASADNGGVVNVNVSDAGDGQVNDGFSDNNTLDPESCSECSSEEDELSDFDEQCAFCCTDDNQISEASCVDAVEGENNVNGDCGGDLLVEAGCSPDLSAPSCFLCRQLGIEE